ncbi:MAG: hypothetical protein ABIL09_19260 [Gemmatimonadota bacterium]
MLDDAARRVVARELEELDELLTSSTELLATPTDANPPFERLAALSTVLTSFYTGLERIFGRIVAQLDAGQPEGERWHIELLNQVAHPAPERPALISEASRARLREYLAFRHRSRHAYAHRLVWAGMAQLVAGLPELWSAVRAEVLQFVQEPSPPDEGA